MKKKLSKSSSVALLLGIYVFTTIVSIVIGYFIPFESPLIKVGVIDLVATIIIFSFSVGFNNSSMYDPYWSVAPIVFVGYWVFLAGISEVESLVIIALVLIWGIRLTFNFFRGWSGMHHEDWRYSDFRERTPKLYWFVSFMGFHFFPTVVVFGASIPIYFALTEKVNPVGTVQALGALISLIAIVIEAIADKQLRRYVLQGNHDGKTLKTGLWAYSRHPNYFGEILFWWGMYVFLLGANPNYWWTIFGPVLMTLLFVFISLPLIENRMKKRRTDYEEVRKTISILIPWF